MIAGVLWSVGKHVWFPEIIREMSNENGAEGEDR